jgi:oxygen-independent coproporphyrinogen-3 oxidase
MPLSLYLHIPFCRTRCAYCDFNTYAGLEDRIPAYVKAMVGEIEQVANGLAEFEAVPDDLCVHTIFFGGGTPSLLPLTGVGALLQAIRSSFDVAPHAEITLEANPGNLAPKKIEALVRLGVNRLSLGAQSADAGELALLGRTHSFQDVAESVRSARAAGIQNLNVDWILGLPHQALPSWRKTLTRALELETEHLSIYALSLEYGTPLRSWVQRGLLPQPDPDLAADMYEEAVTRLEDAGYVQYEISNWARRRPTHESSTAIEQATYACCHNLQYWRNLPYLGFGAGAHGSAFGWRYSNVLSPDGYVRAMAAGRQAVPPASSAVSTRTRTHRTDAMGETMFLGLRLTLEGVEDDDFAARFGVPPGEAYRRELVQLSDQGLVERAGGRTRLTQRGRLLGNRVFEAFV